MRLVVNNDEIIELNPPRTPRRVWTTYALLVVLNIFDIVYTAVILSVDKAAEANPLMAWVFYNYGIEGMTVVKGILLVLLGMGLRYLPTLRHGLLLTRLFYICVIAYTALSVYHVYWFIHNIQFT